LQGISAGSVELLASTALLAEFLPNLLKTQATLLDVTPSVADLACELRELYGMSTWDAVHLATSITGKADVLFVRDNKFPVDQLVQGVWVSAPFDIEGEHLFSDLDSEPGK
jgi:predicted nucleic acid-binding protein